jgi:hypothetical protein
MMASNFGLKAASAPLSVRIPAKQLINQFVWLKDQWKLYVQARQKEQGGSVNFDSCSTDFEAYCENDDHIGEWGSDMHDAAPCPDSWEDEFIPITSLTGEIDRVSDSAQSASACVSRGSKGLISQALDGMSESEYSDLPVAFGPCRSSLLRG